jgi:hypothetical protein
MDYSSTAETMLGQLALCSLKHGVGIATRTSQHDAPDNELAVIAGDVLVNLSVDPNGWLTGNVSGKVASGAIRAEDVTVTKAPVIRRASILKRRRNDDLDAVQGGLVSTAVKRVCAMTDEELSYETSANTEANRVVRAR